MNKGTERTGIALKRARAIFSAVLILGLSSIAKAFPDLPIEIQNTRVVFNEGQPSSVVVVRNKSAIPYLVAVDITTFCGIGKECPITEDFMTSPGFKVISPGLSFPFRIIRLAEKLPADRESLYLVHFRLLPSDANLSDQRLKKARLTVAVAGSMKLFWRPKDLAGSTGVLTVRDMLQARCIGNEIEFTNRSPYWGTFGTLATSGMTLLKDGPLPMIAPFANVRFPIISCPQSVSASFIAESGLLTAERSVPVQK